MNSRNSEKKGVRILRYAAGVALTVLGFYMSAGLLPYINSYTRTAFDASQLLAAI